MDVRLDDSWKAALSSEFAADYFTELGSFVEAEYAKQRVYPAPRNIFRALDACPLNKVKVVILGQDPYHGPGQAQGLSFAVPKDFRLPPSLVNIFKELASDIGGQRTNGDLSDWAAQGVLLLNATLTVRANQAGSHQNRGWEQFTDAVIKTISTQREQIVFVLWGNYARSKKLLIDEPKHLILESPHPSPLSAHRGFFGSRPFSKTNQYLRTSNQPPIIWL